MKLKKIMAGILAGAMMLSTVAVNANPLPTNLTGTNTLVAPVFAVLLPTAPAIAINPLQIGGGQQVSSPWQVVANRSNVPVAINVRIGYNPPATNPATLVADTTGIDARTTDRTAVLQVQWGQLAVEPSANFLGNTTAANLLTHPWAEPDRTDVDEDVFPARQTLLSAAGNLITGTPRTATAACTLRGGVQAVIFLDQHAINSSSATFATDLTQAMTLNQVAAFRFGGNINPSATWTAGQLSARVIFDIRGVNGGLGNEYRDNIRLNNSRHDADAEGSQNRRLGAYIVGTTTLVEPIETKGMMNNVFITGVYDDPGATPLVPTDGRNFDVTLNQPPVTS